MLTDEYIHGLTKGDYLTLAVSETTLSTIGVRQLTHAGLQPYEARDLLQEWEREGLLVFESKGRYKLSKRGQNCLDEYEGDLLSDVNIIIDRTKPLQKNEVRQIKLDKDDPDAVSALPVEEVYATDIWDRLGD